MQESDERKPKKEKWVYKIQFWNGKPKEGKWVPEAIATNVKRTFTRIAKAKGWTKLKPETVSLTTEELVYAHQGYRPHLEGEKETRKAFFFRGARVWR